MDGQGDGMNRENREVCLQVVSFHFISFPKQSEAGPGLKHTHFEMVIAVSDVLVGLPT